VAEKPHIVIIAKGGAGWLGGRQYTVNLLRALVTYRGSADDFDVSVAAKNSAELEHFASLRSALRLSIDLERDCAPYTGVNRLRWRLKRALGTWTNPRLEEMLARSGATFAYPFSSRKISSADWISDFQYSHHPDKMTPAEIAERQIEFSNIVTRAQNVVLSSMSAERDCHRLFPSTVGRTHVLRFRSFAETGWTEGAPHATVEKYHLPTRFVLISNWLLPTKNHLLVLDALASIPEAERRAMHVVCTGDIHDPRNPGFYNVFMNRIHELGLRAEVSHLGVIPKADQIQLLRASVAYLQPSLFEGWNTGVEEAHLLGKPILLSDISVHREQAPAQATMFDPNAASSLAAALRALFQAGDAPGWNAAEEKAAALAYATLQRRFGRDLLAVAGVDLTPARQPRTATALETT